MTDEMIALARRAVACKGWRWMLGMLAHDGYRMVWVGDGLHRSFRINGSESTGWTDQLLPDLTDPATLGCVLAMVRVAFNDDGIGAIRQFVGLANGGCMWSLIGFGGELGKYYASEGEALVAALEAAP